MSGINALDFDIRLDSITIEIELDSITILWKKHRIMKIQKNIIDSNFHTNNKECIIIKIVCNFLMFNNARILLEYLYIEGTLQI